jgi:drug/metabolite transporter (DMT)-like permease
MPFRWISVWFILIPFTYKEIYKNRNYIKKNFLVISFMGIITISTFNSVVYFALNYTQVINAVLVLAAIPALTIILSSLMKIEKTNCVSNIRFDFINYRNRSHYF